jgi:hypothetical protein
MKEVFFSTVFLITLFSCAGDDQNEVLSYAEIGASEDDISKIKPKE